jgi:hypothetical protein
VRGGLRVPRSDHTNGRGQRRDDRGVRGVRPVGADVLRNRADGNAQLFERPDLHGRGGGRSGERDLSVTDDARANLDIPLSSQITAGWSGIYRSVSGPTSYSWITDTYDSVGRAYDSNTIVNAFRVRALLGHRAAVQANLSIERAQATFDGAASDRALIFIKGGAYGSFRF